SVLYGIGNHSQFFRPHPVPRRSIRLFTHPDSQPMYPPEINTNDAVIASVNHRLRRNFRIAAKRDYVSMLRRETFLSRVNEHVSVAHHRGRRLRPDGPNADPG